MAYSKSDTSAAATPGEKNQSYDYRALTEKLHVILSYS